MHAAITRAPIDPGALLDRVRDTGHGAVLLFLGTVRDRNDGRPVTGLRYEVYEAMARAELEAIVREAVARAPGAAIAVEHRVGDLAVSEIAVAIAVAAPHRAEAYEASRYVIEEIKRRLPIWKDERYADGQRRWVEGERPAGARREP